MILICNKYVYRYDKDRLLRYLYYYILILFMLTYIRDLRCIQIGFNHERIQWFVSLLVILM